MTQLIAGQVFLLMRSQGCSSMSLSLCVRKHFVRCINSSAREPVVLLKEIKHIRFEQASCILHVSAYTLRKMSLDHTL